MSPCLIWLLGLVVAQCVAALVVAALIRIGRGGQDHDSPWRVRLGGGFDPRRVTREKVDR